MAVPPGRVTGCDAGSLLRRCSAVSPLPRSSSTSVQRASSWVWTTHEWGVPAFCGRSGVHVCVLHRKLRHPLPCSHETVPAERRPDWETIVTYLDQVAPVFATAEYDQQRRRTAAVADRHADVIFTAAVDQRSRICNDPPSRSPYFFPDEDLLLDDAKHSVPRRRIVMSMLRRHRSSKAPKWSGRLRSGSSPRDTTFEYRELNKVPHAEVLAALREAHIVLNEFYAFVPGCSASRRWRAGAHLLTRADEAIETDLPSGSNAAWVVTTAADIEGRSASALGLTRSDPDPGRRGPYMQVQQHSDGERFRPGPCEGC